MRGQLTAGVESELEQKLLQCSFPRQHLENIVAPEISHNQSCNGADISSPWTYGIVLERSTRSTYGRVCLQKGERVEPSKRVASRLSRIDTRSYPSPRPRDLDAGDNVLRTAAPQTQCGSQLPDSLNPLESTQHFGHPCQSGLQDVSIEAALRDSTISEKWIKRRSSCPNSLNITVQTEPMLDSSTRVRHVLPTRQGSPPLPPSRSSAPSNKTCQYQSRRKLKRSSFDESPRISRTDQREAQLVPSLHDLVSHPLLLPGSSALRTDALTTIPIFDEKEWRQNKSRRSKQSSRNSRVGGVRGHLDAHKRFSTVNPEVRSESCGVRTSSLLKQSSWARTLRLWWSTVSGGKHIQLHSRSLPPSGPQNERTDQHSEEDQQSPKGKSPRDRPPQTLCPDVDYCWTRYEKLEERRFYQMAHAKLMDTQRGLCSQILLTNFMFGYLHKAQREGRQATIVNPKPDQTLSRR